MTRAARVYGWLLRAYPARWRGRFGDGMHAAFAADLERARARGFLVRMAFWIGTVVQALWFGLSERVLGGMSLRSFLAVDWRAAVRGLRAAPMVTTVAIASLALGIGANTALFSILNSLILKPLPVRHPEQLVLFLGNRSFTNPIWEQVRDRSGEALDGVAAYSTDAFDLSTGGRTDMVTCARVSGSFFDVLGLGTVLGRPLTPADDDRRGGANGPVAVITSAFWKARFAGAPDVIGRTIHVQRVPFRIVGVADPAFTAIDIGTDLSILVPIGTDALMRGSAEHLDSRSSWWLHFIGRLKPGQSIDQATAALRAIQPLVRSATIPPRWSEKMQAGYLTTPFDLGPAATGRSPLREQYRGPLIAILAVVGAVLLIACANIASLLLSRAQARRRELSVRLALGASRGRLARQLLVESLVLAGSGAALGLLIASWGSPLLVRQLSTYADVVALDLSLDWRVVGFTTGVAFLTALIFGAAPAFSVTRVEPGEALRDQSRTVAGDRRVGSRQALVVVQVMLSLALVVAAGLFVRTFVALARMPLGFDPRPLTVVDIELPSGTEDPVARFARFDRLRAAAAAVPGVAHAALSNLTPASDSGWNTDVEVPGGVPGLDRRLEWVSPVSPEYFDTYGMQMRAGRAFTGSDRGGAPKVMIVNEAFVKQRFGNGISAVGRVVNSEIEGPSTRATYEIVGVVSDSIYREPRYGAEATMYVPLAQLNELDSSVALTVRAASSGDELVRQLDAALLAVDPKVSTTFRPFRLQLEARMTQERLVAMLAGFFGLLALVMVSLGLYGVTAYWVSRRRAEIGIRIALGAHPAGVVRLVLRQVTWLIVIGIAAGAALSFWAAKFAGKLLFGLEPRDPATFIGASLLLFVVGLGAGWLPARRAAKLDPVKALREQ